MTHALVYVSASLAAVSSFVLVLALVALVGSLVMRRLGVRLPRRERDRA